MFAGRFVLLRTQEPRVTSDVLRGPGPLLSQGNEKVDHPALATATKAGRSRRSLIIYPVWIS